MAEKLLGVKETKEMLVFLFTLGKVAKEAKENDGKITYLDAVLLMKVLPSLGPAIDKADDIVAEIKDIDGDELNELATLVGVELGGLAKEKLVSQVIAGLEVAKSLLAFIKTL